MAERTFKVEAVQVGACFISVQVTEDTDWDNGDSITRVTPDILTLELLAQELLGRVTQTTVVGENL